MDPALKIALFAALGQLLCTAAVGAGSFTALRRYIAAKSLNPEATIEPQTEVAPKPNAMPWYKRRLSKKDAKGLFFFVLFVGSMVFISVGMPMLTTRFFLDVFWGTFEFVLMGFAIHAGMRVIYPLDETASYVRKQPDSPITLVFTPRQSQSLFKNERVRLVIAAILSSAVLVTSYHGSTALHPLVAASWIACMIGTFNLTGVRMKRIMQCLMGYVVIGPIIVGLIILIVSFFASDSKNSGSSLPSDSEAVGTANGNDSFATPSDWMGGVMTIINGSLPSFAPGVVLAMVLRYEYTLAQSPIVLSTTTHSDPSHVPRSTPSFPKPLFTTGMIALATSVLAIPTAVGAGLIQVGDSPNFMGSLQGAVFLLTAPAVIGAICCIAWCKGDLADLCEYSEMWVPRRLPDGEAQKIETSGATQEAAEETSKV